MVGKIGSVSIGTTPHKHRAKKRNERKNGKRKKETYLKRLRESMPAQRTATDRAKIIWAQQSFVTDIAEHGRNLAKK